MDNVKEAHAEVTAANYGGELRIFGGDANIPDVDDDGSNRPWYRQVNGDLKGALNYRDAIYSRCAGDRSCLSGNWTHKSNPPHRIDFLFAGKAGALPAVTNAVTVDFDQADKADKDVTGDDRGDLDYSEHRAIGARIHY